MFFSLFAVNVYHIWHLIKRPLICVVILINVVHLELYLQRYQACQSTCD